MKATHKLDTYKEGWLKVEFCTVCGKEGRELEEDCVPLKKDEAQLELFIDNLQEQP